MKIVHYMPGHQPYFERLNRAWIEKYFAMEPMDEALLTNPEASILNKGGQVFFAEHQNNIIGTAALLFAGNGVYELAKMAVDEGLRGMGAGKLLCSTAIDEAKKLGADKLVVFTHSSLKAAIGIYQKAGFKKVPLDGQEYSRADTKMELLLKRPPAVEWFDREFDFNFGAEQLPALLERLGKTASKILTITNEISQPRLTLKPGGKWSIQEHIGHLWILEPLWQKRFLEIKEQKTKMSPADLNNTATENALFNQYNIEKIIAGFEQEREHTIRLLKSLDKDDLQRSLYHPRLNQPMRITDLAYFVAEHDEHHLSAILKIRNLSIPF